ncbi:MAG: NUDIX hydrolase [Acidimicrobiales bacterium]
MAVDLVVLTVRRGTLSVLLVERGVSPFKGRPALPGGFVLPAEELAEAARRELAEETGIADERVHIEQLATYGRPGRDPRGRVVSVAYLALVPDLPEPSAGSDASGASWQPVNGLLGHPRSLAFDHHEILADAVERARSKLEYSPIGAAFCPAEFTINELRQVYEVVWDCELDPRNFHRKITSTADFVEPTGRRTTRQGGRPAALYRLGTARLLHPPMLRPGHPD